MLFSTNLSNCRWRQSFYSYTTIIALYVTWIQRFCGLTNKLMYKSQNYRSGSHNSWPRVRQFTQPYVTHQNVYVRCLIIIPCVGIGATVGLRALAKYAHYTGRFGFQAWVYDTRTMMKYSVSCSITCITNYTLNHQFRWLVLQMKMIKLDMAHNAPVKRHQKVEVRNT